MSRMKASGGLTVHEGWQAARELCKLDAEGQFRAWKTAPNLKRGWQLHVPDLEGLRLAVDIFTRPRSAWPSRRKTARCGPCSFARIWPGRPACIGLPMAFATIKPTKWSSAAATRRRSASRRIDLGHRRRHLPLGSGAAVKALKGDSARAARPRLASRSCPHLVGEARKIARVTTTTVRRLRPKTSGAFRTSSEHIAAGKAAKPVPPASSRSTTMKPLLALLLAIGLGYVSYRYSGIRRSARTLRHRPAHPQACGGSAQAGRCGNAEGPGEAGAEA